MLVQIVVDFARRVESNPAMPPPTTYCTQYSETAGGLDELVNERLKEGWKLYGQPYSISPADPDKPPLFCQAMTKTPPAKTVTQRLREELGSD